MMSTMYHTGRHYTHDQCLATLASVIKTDGTIMITGIAKINEISQTTRPPRMGIAMSQGEYLYLKDDEATQHLIVRGMLTINDIQITEE